MSDLFPYWQTGCVTVPPNVWSAGLRSINDDAVPMTKAETIMRRTEARVLHRTQTRWLYFATPESELLYGGSPGGGMSYEILRPVLWGAE